MQFVVKPLSTTAAAHTVEGSFTSSTGPPQHKPPEEKPVPEKPVPEKPVPEKPVPAMDSKPPAMASA